MTTPVLFSHGLWLHASSWTDWADLFSAAGYATSAPGWPGEADTVAEARANPESIADHGSTSDFRWDEETSMTHFLPTTATEPFWFLGGQAKILVPGEATAGAVSVVEFRDPLGHATPLHIHDHEDEIWTVLDGEISFFVGEDRYDLAPGDIAFGPKGVPHASVTDHPAPFDLGAVVAYHLRVAGPPPSLD